MASQEMLKKLLEEFDEKEAQAREEINIVNVRIEELEKRIGSSQQRLERISGDRTKINEMMERYVNGKFRTQGATTYSAAPSSSESSSKSSAPAAAAAVTPTTLPEPAAASSPTPSISSPMQSLAGLTAGIAPSSPAHSTSPATIAALSMTIPPSGSSPAAAPTPSPAFSPMASPALSVVASNVTAATPGPALSPLAALESEAAAPPPPPPPPPPIGSSQPLSPLASLSAASLFSSPPPNFAAPTATGENPTLEASQSSSSPFAMAPPPPQMPPPGGLSAALMQSMPTGGAGTPGPQETRGPGKFDMMDLFAPLATDSDTPPDAPTSTPAPHVAEDALAQNQFYSSPATAADAVAPTVTEEEPSPPSTPSAATASIDSTATQDHPSLDLGEDSAQEEENDDTVKSINDALRGLFR